MSMAPSSRASSLDGQQHLSASTEASANSAQQTEPLRRMQHFDIVVSKTKLRGDNRWSSDAAADALLR